MADSIRKSGDNRSVFLFPRQISCDVRILKNVAILPFFCVKSMSLTCPCRIQVISGIIAKKALWRWVTHKKALLFLLGEIPLLLFTIYICYTTDSLLLLFSWIEFCHWLKKSWATMRSHSISQNITSKDSFELILSRHQLAGLALALTTTNIKKLGSNFKDTIYIYFQF